MTNDTDPAGPFAIVCMDPRGPKGERFRSLAFNTTADAHRWIDRADDATRRALVAGGFRVQPMPGKPSRRRRWIRRRREVRALLTRLRRAGACQLCGEPDPIVLDFHHVDPASKRFTVGGRRCRTMSAVTAEVTKCCLICSNCHRRVNAGAVDATGLVPLALPGEALLAAAP